MDNDPRLSQLTDWIYQDWPQADIQVASADASFRRYFRINHNDVSYIAMDAPPEKEDCKPFVDITQRLLKIGVHAPEIIKQDLEQGFLLLEDLGSTPYLEVLDEQRADSLYKRAIDALIQLQQADTRSLPHYDTALLLTEMQLMPEWFLKTHLDISLNETEAAQINQVFDGIINEVITQPQVFVHRDYHSRNLMHLEKDSPGIIDYQDANLGPCTYDLASLLRDCYIQWPENRVLEWAEYFLTHAINHQLIPAETDINTFTRWFDLTGLQRHIKVLGIFSRLYHRDGKKGYLNDLPLTLHYVMNIANKYPQTQPLVSLFKQWSIDKKIRESIRA